MSEFNIPTPPSTTISDPPSPTEFQQYYTTDRRPSNNPFNYPPVDHGSDELTSPITDPNRSMSSILKTTMTTITPITLHPKPIYIVVATALNPSMGIGHKGQLPWKSGIKADMKFFREVTGKVSTGADVAPGIRCLNAVIMGRKTWESIPSKFRPLSGRLNVVITGKPGELAGRILGEVNASGSNQWEARDLTSDDEQSQPTTNTATASSTTTILIPPEPSSPSSAVPIIISSSIPSTLALLSSTNRILPDVDVSVDKLFCIGGAEVYRQILSLANPPSSGDQDETRSETTTDATYDIRILQTQVHRLNGEAFQCDTFFPEDLSFASKESDWRAVSSRMLERWTQGVQMPHLQQDVTDEGELEDEEGDGWLRDDKAGVEIRVVGWERR